MKMMNVTLVRSEPKLLAEAAQPCGTASKSLPEHRQGSKSTKLYNFEEIQYRAEAVTPTLKGIFDLPPPEHWGLNE
jgi:hypothetical protein